MASILALSDVMSTGYHAAVSAGVTKGQTVAVVGDGAVGLSGVLSAKMLGAERVIVLGSTTESRHELAREWGATDIITARGDDAVKALQDLTDGYGADAVLECVGTKEATETAFAVAKAGAIVGRVGVPHDAEIDPLGTFFRNVGMRGGPAPARAYQPELLQAVLNGDINPGKVFDLTIDLDDIAEAYAAMDERRAIKALVKVSDLWEVSTDEVHKSGGATATGPADWFTGTVFIDGIRNPDEQSAVGCAHVRFTPGARTAWHNHPKGQTLYVTDGIGYVATPRRRRSGDPPRQRGLHRARRGALARRHRGSLHGHVAIQEADAPGRS